MVIVRKKVEFWTNDIFNAEMDTVGEITITDLSGTKFVTAETNHTVKY